MVTVLWSKHQIVQLCVMIIFSTDGGINDTFYIKFEHNLCIIKINKCLVAKNLLTNVTITNEYSNIMTFVHALIPGLYTMTIITALGD